MSGLIFSYLVGVYRPENKQSRTAKQPAAEPASSRALTLDKIGYFP